MLESDQSGAAAVKSAHANSVKASFLVSRRKSLSEKMSKYKEKANKKAFPNISSVRMAPSTDTTLSAPSTKVEDDTNGSEIHVKKLDVDSDNGGLKTEASDDASIESSASSVVSRYFEPTDFMPWEQLYSTAEYAPHVGFAIAAGSFAFLHPIVFFAGVVTAVGTARAASATYDYAMCVHNSRRKGHKSEESMASDLILPCDCFNALGLNDSLRDSNLGPKNALPPSPQRKMKQAYSIPPPMVRSDSTSSTNSSSIGDLRDDANGRSKLCRRPLHSIPTIIESPRRTLSPKETFDSSGWVRENFPTLPIVALQDVEFRGLNALEFFDVFFADDAPFGFPAFHILRRDKEVQYSPWTTGIKSDEHYTKIELPSSSNTMQRTVQYLAKTNSFLGPAYAPTRKIQRAYFVSKKMLVIDIRMTLHDIPFSKQFYMTERWVIDGTRNSTRKEKKTKNYINSPKPCSSHCVFLTVSSEVCFTEECSFESAVRKESTKQVCEVSKCWNAMAQAGLKRTEETRTKRLREKERSLREMSNASRVGECIEIEHIDDRHSKGRRRDKRRRSSIRTRRRRSSSIAQSQQSQDQVPNRRLSQSFSKLLNRSSSTNLAHSGERGQAYPKVRISSEGIV